MANQHINYRIYIFMLICFVIQNRFILLTPILKIMITYSGACYYSFFFGFYFKSPAGKSMIGKKKE